MDKRGLIACGIAVAGAVGAALGWSQCKGRDEIPQGVVFLDQGWLPADRNDYYTRSQGSRMIPYPWIRALKRADADGLFMENSLERYGFLPYRTTSNRDGLPVGWVVDDGRPVGTGETGAARQRWLGLTCAACHTSQLKYKETIFQIDGGPALGDFGAFMTDLDRALQATRADPSKFETFARSVLGNGYAAGVAQLKTEFDAYTAGWTKFVDENTPKRAPWGRARVDAFGVIFNRVSVTALGIAENLRDPDAPVSYPFLWGTHDEDFVQWNADTQNRSPIDHLGRNTGEALGVFGQMDLTRDTGPWPFYRTSIRRIGLLRLEHTLAKLQPPKWPAGVLGDLDEAKRERGRLLFERNCAMCHAAPVPSHGTRVTVGRIPLEKSDPELSPAIRAVCEVQSLRTDPQMARNNATRTVKTGHLEGAKFPFIDKLLGKESLAVNLVSHVGAGAVLEPPSLDFHITDLEDLLGAPRDVLDTVNELRLGLGNAVENVSSSGAVALIDGAVRSKMVQEATNAVASEVDPAPKQAYKARPLDGIWATAPYLHNGSVPTLADLLLPANLRPMTFHVGDATFDPVRVGYITTPSPSSTLFDTALLPPDADGFRDGNTNVGHEGFFYTQLLEGGAWRDFTEQERSDLVEYMKGL